MKKAFAVFPLALALGIGAVGCGSDAQPTDGSGEGVSGSSQDQLLAATGNIMMWPTGPIVWDGLNATWPIAVWSGAQIGALAFDVAGVSNLAVTAVGLPGVVAVPIATPFLNACTGAGVGFGAPLLSGAGLLAPGVGIANVGFGAFAPGIGALDGTFVDGALTTGLTAWMTPALTANALMFSSLAASTAMAPLMFNLTFTATAAAQTAIAAQNFAGLSIFATPIALNAITAGTAIPFTSMMFPIMAPFGGAALGAAIAAPAIGAAAVGAPVVGAAVPGVL